MSASSLTCVPKGAKERIWGWYTEAIGYNCKAKNPQYGNVTRRMMYQKKTVALCKMVIEVLAVMRKFDKVSLVLEITLDEKGIYIRFKNRNKGLHMSPDMLQDYIDWLCWNWETDGDEHIACDLSQVFQDVLDKSGILRPGASGSGIARGNATRQDHDSRPKF